jgi:hypothetical protein
MVYTERGDILPGPGVMPSPVADVQARSITSQSMTTATHLDRLGHNHPN